MQFNWWTQQASIPSSSTRREGVPGPTSAARDHGAASLSADARDVRVGCTGPTLPSAQVAVAVDCSLFVRGLLAMAGYRDRPQGTAAAIDADGWLRTAAQIDDLYTTKEKP